MSNEKRPAGAAFWNDLKREMADPEFRHAYVTESLRLRMIDHLVNTIQDRQIEVGWSPADLARAIGQKPGAL